MKTISMLAVASAMMLMFSFKVTDNNTKVTNLAGKYGAFCNDTESAGTTSMLLILNSDNTFQFTDHSVRDAKVNVFGKWSIYEGDVYLSDYDNAARIPRIWKTEKESTCLKARKGTMFLRLCRQAD